MKFRVNWPFGSGDEIRNRLSNGNMAAILDFQMQRFRRLRLPYKGQESSLYR